MSLHVAAAIHCGLGQHVDAILILKRTVNRHHAAFARPPRSAPPHPRGRQLHAVSSGLCTRPYSSDTALPARALGRYHLDPAPRLCFQAPAPPAARCLVGPVRHRLARLAPVPGLGRGFMASNYVDTAAEEGRFHGHHHSTTPTGAAAAASPKTMRRSWSSANGHSHGHGAAPKCVCAPATHAGSFKCRLHRSSSHGHTSSPPSPAAATTSAAPAPAVPPPSSRTVAAQ
ncbi:hypothetical protein BAE44_0023253 [Dichanthelium oligosanthes]|uniref:Uncharacterized protein n=1 Tax=Dichanthelium oligosanthes TaxID=888268 RepID=A0A1E5US90_9POAL|nr:hypothetical protein BAE44_0023253 [Dichanthelium oligosanthes]